MKIVITGATGFIGRHTLPSLLKKGYEIHAISTHATSLPNAVVHKCNLFDATAVASLLQTIRPDTLLHLAWMTTPGKYLSAPENLNWLEASLRLVRHFVENGGKRAVIAGTCAEYESKPLCFEDHGPFKPTTFYARCKRALFETLENYAQLASFELAWGYLFYLYGPFEHPDRFLPTVIRGMLQQKEVPLTEGTQIRDFLHVRDAAEALVELVNSQAIGGYNIASGKGISIRDIVELIANKLGRKDLLKFGARPPSFFDPPELVADISKLKNATSWSPSIDLDQGIEEAINWWTCQKI